tara:strand:+ start:1248 stop:2963 length:1716 start_codon:yes stop_codon:yes gene_type:complete
VNTDQLADPFLSFDDPIIKRIFNNRGIFSLDEIDTSITNLLHFNLLSGMDGCVDYLVNALENNQSICIVGDYDVDGATSTALMVSCLRALGFKDVGFFVPNRFIHGYGLSRALVDAILVDNPNVQTLVTVDNGIASHDGVSYSNTRNIDVIVTDHHLPGAQLPDACAIVNPNQVDCQFPCKSLSGCGVAFYVLLALRSKLLSLSWFDKQGIVVPNMADYLDLVALATVADLVPMSHNNRILTQQGIERIRKSISRPGIRALMAIANIDHTRIQTTDFGYKIAPRLNAAGRLKDMSIGVKCLLADSHDEALQYAKQLDQLNQERKMIEANMKNDAIAIIDHIGDIDQQTGICLFDDGWHEGVIGIVASRLKEAFYQPIAVFTATDTPGVIKGSLRSVTGINLKELLNRIQQANPDIMLQFGGHAMAAGISMKQANFNTFSDLFQQEVAKLADYLIQRPIMTDGELPLSHLTLSFANQLVLNYPWGQAFPQPIFEQWFSIKHQSIIAHKHLKLLLQLPAAPSNVFEAICFNIDLKQWPDQTCGPVKIMYHLSCNCYKGCEKIQLIVMNLDKHV